jgi:indolepyruvate decarboxylase
MARAVEAIGAALAGSAGSAGRPETAAAAPAATPAGDGSTVPPNGTVTQDAFWTEFRSYLQPGDVVLVDPGSGMFPMTSGSRPDGVTLYNQKTWAAIGWALPATLGAALAAPDRRHICIIGDGALSMTVQELSTIAREGCSPLVVVVNNGGYLIEDFAINGLHLDCDDIWVWDYPALAAAFDDRRRHRPLGLQVTTAADIAEALKKAAEGQLDGRLVVLDAVFGRDDMPASMRTMHEARVAAAAQGSRP